MPVCTLVLLSLRVPPAELLSALSKATPPVKPLVASRVVRWIVVPRSISADALLHRNVRWDLLLVLPPEAPELPTNSAPMVAARNAVLLGTKEKRECPPREGTAAGGDGTGGKTPESSENLELSAELRDWVAEWGGDGREGENPVSMLNLLAFEEGMKDTYIKYGEEFAARVGRKRGGVAKITGVVVEDGGGRGLGGPGGEESRGGGGGGAGAGKGKADGTVNKWDQIAIAHYPSIRHFADMLAAEDYQEVNMRYRVPSLKDTFILCTTEVGAPWGEGGNEKGSKL
ncbi:hypothetical protein MKZ38_005276 [Zalerion maritima]|uniref:Uncharacterized protein n=1 Tax=Zalerion maritima TaxID=339359 RepID=A0AAD5RLD6_9PEZI|nr:hypothetical protein MKZ38_005276 [Zalerion maritima]